MIAVYGACCNCGNPDELCAAVVADGGEACCTTCEHPYSGPHYAKRGPLR